MPKFDTSKRSLLIILAVVIFAITSGTGYYFYQKKKLSKQIATSVAKKTTDAVTSVSTINPPAISTVLTDLFGIKTSSDKVVNSPEQLSSLWFAQPFEQGQNKFYAFFVKTQNIDPETKAPLDSHADAPGISVAVYQQTGQQWTLYSKQINIGSFGSWGDVPDIKSVPTLQLSANNLVFLIDGGFSGQGYTEAGNGLFNYNIKNKTWKDLGFIQTGGDNAGACDDKPQPGDSLLSACWEFSGKITLAKTAKNPEFPDLLVVVKGTISNDNNKIVPATNRLYLFNGEQYAEAGAEAR